MTVTKKKLKEKNKQLQKELEELKQQNREKYGQGYLQGQFDVFAELQNGKTIDEIWEEYKKFSK